MVPSATTVIFLRLKLKHAIPCFQRMVEFSLSPRTRSIWRASAHRVLHYLVPLSLCRFTYCTSLWLVPEALAWGWHGHAKLSTSTHGFPSVRNVSSSLLPAVVSSLKSKLKYHLLEAFPDSCASSLLLIITLKNLSTRYACLSTSLSWGWIWGQSSWLEGSSSSFSQVPRDNTRSGFSKNIWGIIQLIKREPRFGRLSFSLQTLVLLSYQILGFTCIFMDSSKYKRT